MKTLMTSILLSAVLLWGCSSGEAVNSIQFYLDNEDARKMAREVCRQKTPDALMKSQDCQNVNEAFRLAYKGIKIADPAQREAELTRIELEREQRKAELMAQYEAEEAARKEEQRIAGELKRKQMAEEQAIRAAKTKARREALSQERKARAAAVEKYYADKKANKS